MQPLGSASECIEVGISEVVFSHVSKLSEHLNEMELHDLILKHLDETSGRNFAETVNTIWTEEAIKVGRDIVRGPPENEEEHMSRVVEAS